MGIEVEKSAFPTLFNFGRIRAASQPHVTMRLLLQKLGYFEMQRVRIFQMIRHKKVLDPQTFACFASFLHVEIVKSQEYDL